jgi:hypothetical protein
VARHFIHLALFLASATTDRRGRRCMSPPR